MLLTIFLKFQSDVTFVSDIEVYYAIGILSLSSSHVKTNVSQDSTPRNNMCRMHRIIPSDKASNKYLIVFLD